MFAKLRLEGLPASFYHRIETATAMLAEFSAEYQQSRQNNPERLAASA